MLEERHRLEADKFFRMIADHGRFNRAQLIRYVEMKTGETLGKTDIAALFGYAYELGAKREPKSLAPVYQLPVQRPRTTLPASKRDKHTLDMWGK